MATFPLDQLGGRQSGASTFSFGVLLPWVTPGNNQSVVALVIHEADQFLQDIPVVPVTLTHAVDPIYGDLWSGSVDVALPTSLPGGAHWGQPGRYVYRLVVRDPNQGDVDWVIDPYAREFGVGKQSVVTLGAEPYQWSAADAAWQVPGLMDLAMYEINIVEFHTTTAGVIDRLDYLADLGINCLSIMPVTNIASEVDWGYLPVGYFGVDERFAGGDAFKKLIDAAHTRGIAVIVDSVYGHASRALFADKYLYDRLRYTANPFMGPFAKDYFADQGASTDFNRPLAQDFFLAVNLHWLEEYHVDGFRYDCVPNYWDGLTGVGYSKLVFNTHELVAQRLGAGQLTRFGDATAATLIQCAEQLEDPVGVLWQSYSNTTWQDSTLNAALAVAAGADNAIDNFGYSLGLGGFPTEVTANGSVMVKTALQYLETHDHSRLLAAFGVVQTDDIGNYLFLVGDRSRWYKLQPYLISLLTCKGIPLLFQGEELAEGFTLPGNGLGRIALLRPINWDYFYDSAGRTIVSLVRLLLRLRRTRSELRSSNHYYYADPVNYQNRGVMIFSRILGGQASVIAVNFSESTAQVPFTFPLPGHWKERILNQDQLDVAVGQSAQLTVTSNYGQLWTLG